MTPAPYGYCPICAAPGKERERRANGDDRCENGHTYPSRDAKEITEAIEKAVREERAAVVALLRKAAADHETELKAPLRAEGMAWLRGGCAAIYDALDAIERGGHRREEEG
jgi:hypothetical protein